MHNFYIDSGKHYPAEGEGSNPRGRNILPLLVLSERTPQNTQN